MLIRIIYVSTAVGPQTETLTIVILKNSKIWNEANGVTGVLCQGQGVFLQVLEGERNTVTKLYSRIYADPRHTAVGILHCESITNRRYKDWSMALVSLGDLELQSKIDWPEFDPYSATGLLVMARIDELLACGSVIEAPKA